MREVIAKWRTFLDSFEEGPLSQGGILMDLEALSRGLLLIEAGIAVVGLLLLRRPERLSDVPRTGNLLWLRILGFWLHLAFFGAAISLGGAVLGWTGSY